MFLSPRILGGGPPKFLGAFVNWHHFWPTGQVWLRSHSWCFIYADEIKNTINYSGKQWHRLLYNFLLLSAAIIMECNQCSAIIFWSIHRCRQWSCMVTETPTRQWVRWDKCRTAKCSRWRMLATRATWMTMTSGIVYSTISSSLRKSLKAENNDSWSEQDCQELLPISSANAVLLQNFAF